MSVHLGFCLTNSVDDLFREGADYNTAWARFAAVVAFRSAVGLKVATKQVQLWCETTCASAGLVWVGVRHRQFESLLN